MNGPPNAGRAADAAGSAIGGVDEPRRRLITDHLAGARWFAAKGLPFRLVSVVALPWFSRPGDPVAVRAEIVGIDVGAATQPPLRQYYQLVLAYRPSTETAPAGALGAVRLPDLGDVLAYDAARDPDAMAVLWRGFVAGVSGPDPAQQVRHHLVGGRDLDPALPARVFTGEQSNTSVMFGDVAMLKLFRRLELGRNLDIEVHEAFSTGGEVQAAHLYGWTEAQWSDGGATMTADLGMVVEQLRDARDGWELAVAACREGRDFSAEAGQLGAALRSVHRALYQKFPHQTVPGAGIEAVMQTRLAAAVADADALIPYQDALHRTFAALAERGDLPVQRVHGDFHLGQVLFTATGPKIIDFEGEPLKTMAERVVPDSVWRDVAGLIRSFGYAAGTVGLTDDADRAGAWARRCRDAFLAAYGGGTSAEEEAVLDAYLADKAIYEVRYELRNRPTWVAIPLHALADLTATPDPSAPDEGTPMPNPEPTTPEPTTPEPTPPEQEQAETERAHPGGAHGGVDPAGGLTGEHLRGFHSGGDTELWRRLGSHTASFPVDGSTVAGTRFAVWAPNAQAVSVVGDFNDWDTDRGRMQLIPGTGVWGGFVADIGPGTVYKYRVHCTDGVWRDKADPMAQFAEGPPATGSIVWESTYQWQDDQWLARRAQAKPHAEPMSIYELHLPSWRKGLSYLELADQLVEYVTWQGYTHVEFMPLTQHPFAGSWGYQVTGYFAPYSPLGTPDELRYLIDRLHQAGIGVLMDWVPGHFPKDEWALGRFDGTALYEHADPRQGEQLDWGTYVFNFGRSEVKSFLVSNALYWVQEFHIDGLRVDAVASMLYLDYSRPADGWVPNIHGGNENYEAIDFLRYVNQHLYERVPGVITVAEESTSFPGVTRPVHHGGLGFGFKWNMGWMNDTLGYLEREPIYRQYHHHEMTFAMVYAFSENFVLPISHDEVVHGKGSMINKIPGDDWQKFASLRAFYAFMFAHPGKQLIFQGCEFGQRAEFSETAGPEWWVSDLWGHDGLQKLFRDLNHLYRDLPALWKLDNDPAGFRWINANDAGANTFSFVRLDDSGQQLAAVINFSATPLVDHRIGLPAEGQWTEVLNTDNETYDGTGQFGNLGMVSTTAEPWDGYEASATVTVPPMGAVWFTHQAPQ